jgi:hypothetical protein
MLWLIRWGLRSCGAVIWGALQDAAGPAGYFPGAGAWRSMPIMAWFRVCAGLSRYTELDATLIRLTGHWPACTAARDRVLSAGFSVDAFKLIRFAGLTLTVTYFFAPGVTLPGKFT